MYRLLLGAFLALSFPVEAADIYIYQSNDGSRLITDHPRFEPGYRLISVYPDGDVWSEPVRAYGNSNSAGRVLPATKSLALRSAAQEPLIQDAARRFEIDPALIKSVMHAESAFQPDAVSSKGASGLMQLMPATARRYGVRQIFNPRENVNAGVRYLRDLLEQFNGNLHLALAGYNAGENAVLRYGGIPPYPETENYVDKVVKLYQRYGEPPCDPNNINSPCRSAVAETKSRAVERRTVGSLQSGDSRWRKLE